MRNRAIFASNAPRAKRESIQKQRNTRQEDHSQPPAGPEPSKACTTCTKWTRQKAGSRPPLQLFTFLTFKNMFRFCPLLSPKIPRKHQGEQIKIHFCPDCLKICHDEVPEDSGRQEDKMGCLIYGEPAKSDHPPHLRSDKCLLPS